MNGEHSNAPTPVTADQNLCPVHGNAYSDNCVCCGAAKHRNRAAEPVECAEDDHVWDYISDWIGDPNVVNGTMSIYSKRCETCGKEAEWNGRHDADMEYERDPSDYRDIRGGDYE